MLQVRATPVYQYPQDIYEAAPVSREDLRAGEERGRGAAAYAAPPRDCLPHVPLFCSVS
jgi:hypothetical protein